MEVIRTVEVVKRTVLEYRAYDKYVDIVPIKESTEYIEKKKTDYSKRFRLKIDNDGIHEDTAYLNYSIGYERCYFDTDHDAPNIKTIFTEQDLDHYDIDEKGLIRVPVEEGEGE